tara:strand:- start:37 stop:1926 length:1890 start_codon:yes stop_codon:yes gene_type:complete
MAAYKDLIGQKITKVTSNPGEPKTGQMWYNSTAGKIRALAIAEAWASTAPLIEARSSGAGFGVSTAAVYAGGQQPPGPGAANTFEYNGSGWSTGGSLNTARMELGGTTAGIETAGLCFGGNTAPGWNGTAATEEYNGTAWTSVNNMATTVSSMGGSGIQTAAFSAGGRTPSNTNNSQEYDGTDWSNGNNINTTRQFLAGMGTQTAGIIAGGESPSGGTNSAETYDGTNFTAAPNMGTARYRLSGSGSDSTACLVFGGRFNPPAADKAQTESFDGTSWTEKADLATARQQLSGNRGTSSSAIAAGGLPPPASQTTDTEEFTRSTNTITAAAWSSSGAIPIPVRGGASGGTKTAAWLTGGLGPGGPSDKDNTYLYDGSAWTAGNDLPNNYFIGGGTGPATAGLVWDGMTSGGGPGTTTYEFDGTNWTSASTFPAIGPGGSQGSTGAGVGQTAAVALGGVGDPPPAQSSRMIAYDGSSWSADESMPAGVSGCAADGPNTAIWIAGGYSNPDTTSTSSQEYDGSSWTTTGSLVSAAPQGLQFQGWGPQTSAILAGGSSGGAPNNHNCQQYNGTIWATAASLATGRNNHAFCSKTAGTKEGFVAGGYEDSGNTNATEEFTDETSTGNVADFTTS